MADFCTMMTVVPTGGIDRSSEGPLGCGPTDLCGVAFAFAVEVAVAPPPGLDVDIPVADDAAGAGADPLLDEGKLEAPPPAAEVEPPGDPPHAASSSTKDPSPVAAAHPLLRITSPNSRDGSRCSGPAVPGRRASRYKVFPGRQVPGPGTPEPYEGSAAADDVARRQLDHVPLAVHAVTGRGQGLRALEDVQRVTVVDDLGDAAVLDRGERGQAGVGRADGRLVALHREPGLEARAGASRGAALVLVVHVDNLTVAHGEHVAELARLLHVQHGRTRLHAQRTRRAGRRVTSRRRSRVGRRGARRRARRSPARG